MNTIPVYVAPWSKFWPLRPTRPLLREAVKDTATVIGGEFVVAPEGRPALTIREALDAGYNGLEVRHGDRMVAIIAISRDTDRTIVASVL